MITTEREEVGPKEALPALLLAVVPASLFIYALGLVVYSSCPSNVAAVASEAEQLGIGAPFVFVAPLFLLPMATLASLALLLKGVRVRRGAALIFWAFALGLSVYLMSLVSPGLLGGALRAGYCRVYLP